jgi:CRISPR-associated protein Csm3
MSKLVKKIKIQKTIELISGLHIGGSKENVEIGGIDSPVIKIATKKNQPYIPGSSLKGKMRCLLEQINGASEVGENENVNKLFGKMGDCTRLIVRDAMLTKESEEALSNNDNLDMPYTESKWENSIDRTKGTAISPRQLERVPAGTKFDVEFIINVWDNDNEEKLLELLEEGIAVLENDYIGGSGSRGYGQIKFSNREKNIELTPENNWKG